MFRLVWTFLKGCFTFFCIVGAMFMTVWLMYEYILDKDVSSVNFKYFHENKDNIYPSITMCFGDDNQFNYYWVILTGFPAVYLMNKTIK